MLLLYYNCIAVHHFATTLCFIRKYVHVSHSREMRFAEQDCSRLIAPSPDVAAGRLRKRPNMDHLCDTLTRGCVSLLLHKTRKATAQTNSTNQPSHSKFIINSAENSTFDRQNSAENYANNQPGYRPYGKWIHSGDKPAPGDDQDSSSRENEFRTIWNSKTRAKSIVSS